MPEDQESINPQQMMQMFQQKIGNLELTVHALMQVLEEEDLLDQERINEKAQEIVKEMQNQDVTGEVPSPEEVNTNKEED